MSQVEPTFSEIGSNGSELAQKSFLEPYMIWTLRRLEVVNLIKMIKFFISEDKISILIEKARGNGHLSISHGNIG